MWGRCRLGIDEISDDRNWLEYDTNFKFQIIVSQEFSNITRVLLARQGPMLLCRNVLLQALPMVIEVYALRKESSVPYTPGRQEVFVRRIAVSASKPKILRRRVLTCSLSIGASRHNDRKLLRRRPPVEVWKQPPRTAPTSITSKCRRIVTLIPLLQNFGTTMSNPNFQWAFPPPPSDTSSRQTFTAQNASINSTGFGSSLVYVNDAIKLDWNNSSAGTQPTAIQYECGISKRPKMMPEGWSFGVMPRTHRPCRSKWYSLPQRCRTGVRRLTIVYLDIRVLN